MHQNRWYTLLTHSLCIAGGAADFLGPTYPPPRDFCSDKSIIHRNWTNLTSTFDGILDSKSTKLPKTLEGIANVTFSFGMFSLHDPDATALQYHYTAPQIRKAADGTNKVDGDSIYRVASVSKLITAFAGMVELTDEEWNRPVTEILPEFAKYANKASAESDPYLITQWDEVTPWTLVSQMGGVATLGIPGGDQLVSFVKADGSIDWDAAGKAGLPQVDVSNFLSCLTPNCTGNDFIDAVSSQPPVFLPSTTPAYSDEGFMLLGLLFAKLKGKSINDIYHDSVFAPLHMSSSKSVVPKPNDPAVAHAVVAGNYSANFGLDFPVTTPSGGLYSTTNDLAKFGKGILNNTLLQPNVTRKWMKPHSHTASLTYSVGDPWEIIRYIHPSTGKVTDLYTKLGDSGAYGGAVVLIPEYDAGFSMLNAWANPDPKTPGLRGELANYLTDYVVDAVLPALEAQAAHEAAANYAGTYSDSKLNSSLTIAANTTAGGLLRPSLIITNWISNGTDMLATWLPGGARLLPTILEQPTAKGSVAFQASQNIQTTTYAEAAKLGAGPFSGGYVTNFDWETVDALHYGGRSLKLFIFEVDGNGKAEKVQLPALRSELKREE